MITLEQMRKIDPELMGLDDKAVEEIRTAFYDAAQLAYEVLREKKSGSKNPLGSFPYQNDLGTIKPCQQKQKRQA